MPDYKDMTFEEMSEAIETLKREPPQPVQLTRTLLLDVVPVKAAPVKPVGPFTETQREEAQLDWFDANLGAGDEVLLDELLRIALGQASVEGIDSKGNMRTKRPSFSDQVQAAQVLMDRHRGRPTQKTLVEVVPKETGRWDPDKLELSDLKALKAIRQKALVGEPSDGEKK